MTILRDAANILDTSEYDVFFQAYTHWYGKAAPTDVINRAFSAYLKYQQTPHWARHYALEVIARFETEIASTCKCFGLFWQLSRGAGAKPAKNTPVLFA